jgi:hypothetical protein
VTQSLSLNPAPGTLIGLLQCVPSLEMLTVTPPGLGNVLAAMEDGAGRTYGLDAVIVWPRLYPLWANSPSR